MKVFVVGATGYIGFNVACAFRRAGHEVWGLARSEAKARELARHEVRPVMGTLQEPASYLAAARVCSLLVHCAADWQADTMALDRVTIDALLGAGDKSHARPTFIYTSGVWIQGATGPHPADETAPLAPPAFLALRPEHERLVLGSPAVRGIVLRPGCVYGKSGGLTGMWFAPAAKDEEVRLIAGGHNRWATVHVDDLAEAYVRTAECGVEGEVLLLADGSRATVAEMAAAAVRAAGSSSKLALWPLAEASRAMGSYADGLALDQAVDARKAERVLAWRPRHRGFVDEVDVYFAAWKSHQAATA